MTGEMKDSRSRSIILHRVGWRNFFRVENISVFSCSTMEQNWRGGGPTVASGTGEYTYKP